MSDREPADTEPASRQYGRRAFLGAAAGAALTAAACSAEGTPGASSSTRAGASGSTTAATAAPSAGPQTSTAAAPATPARAPRPALLSAPGPDITNGPRTREEVGLTFHGQGPEALTRRVLAECRAADAGITVFAVGAWLAANPGLGRAIVAAGHELGNHTWSHQQMPQLDAGQAAEEVARGAAALEAAVGSAGWWFRPSGTPHSTATIRAAALKSGYQRCISYDVDPEDYRDPGAALVRTRTRRHARPGSIISLHLGHAGTVQALPGILSDLSTAGLRPVTLSVLLRD
ncbi:MAG TPA: polysaccharide deacetylase family protein [Pedococcus sp.]|nr:polysaccharide deacetylase family protein [Pedococcus sp.]